ncbi:MAG TPA: 2-amino-4-hydroxy-6-hydroxymethyldihydropteridine diphosphokinase [Candidatus Polarisedimenticolaceae bacterium]|nr:2-amino-4-hydroxy-6-hydroxymethyldihydropteridine diphosphokinase [Candidatus Polarisedimenticolaceae bacterium]
MVGFVALGSNVGDREEHLREALAAMEERGVLPVALSSLWETEPVGGAGPAWFLNMVAKIETSLPPEAVLETLLAIERRRGRIRAGSNAPRELDLDLLLLGNLRREGPALTLPHPRMTSRRFVLAPLAEVAPEFAGALAKVDDPHEVRNVGKLVYSRAL